MIITHVVKPKSDSHLFTVSYKVYKIYHISTVHK